MSTLLSLNKKKEGNNMKVKVIDVQLTTDENTITNNCEYETLKVTDIIERNGEFWLEITFAENCETYTTENTKLKTGWIKWRNSEILLVRIQLLC